MVYSMSAYTNMLETIGEQEYIVYGLVDKRTGKRYNTWENIFFTHKEEAEEFLDLTKQDYSPDCISSAEVKSFWFYIVLPETIDWEKTKRTDSWRRGMVYLNEWV